MELVKEEAKTQDELLEQKANLMADMVKSIGRKTGNRLLSDAIHKARNQQEVITNMAVANNAASFIMATCIFNDLENKVASKEALIQAYMELIEEELEFIEQNRGNLKTLEAGDDNDAKIIKP